MVCLRGCRGRRLLCQHTHGPWLLCPVESFGFAVLPGLAGLDQDELGVQPGEYALKILREPECGRAIRHHPFRRCRVRGLECDRSGEEPGAGGPCLIRMDFNEPAPGMIVDGHVNAIETDPGVTSPVVREDWFGSARQPAPLGSVRVFT